MSKTWVKVGDIVKIIGNYSCHSFPIGECVRIVSIEDADDFKAEYLDGHNFWWLCERDFEIIENVPHIPQQTEWKIRHIKSDDYKSGRDVAITILYKEIGNGYYEYKFAICGPNDMFSRKKGVEEALKKESDKLYDEGSAPFIGLVLMHMSVSNKFSKSARSLILSKMAELV